MFIQVRQGLGATPKSSLVSPKLVPGRPTAGTGPTPADVVRLSSSVAKQTQTVNANRGSVAPAVVKSQTLAIRKAQATTSSTSKSVASSTVRGTTKTMQSDVSAASTSTTRSSVPWPVEASPNAEIAYPAAGDAVSAVMSDPGGAVAKADIASPTQPVAQEGATDTVAPPTYVDFVKPTFWSKYKWWILATGAGVGLTLWIRSR